MPRDYKNIKAWQMAKQFVLQVYTCTKNFPKEELYGLTSQIRRACVSVVANIAEGASRQHKKDYLNFLYNAKGSLSEAECLLGVAKELEYLDETRFNEVDALCQKTASTLYGLIQAVEKEL